MLAAGFWTCSDVHKKLEVCNLYELESLDPGGQSSARKNQTSLGQPGRENRLLGRNASPVGGTCPKFTTRPPLETPARSEASEGRSPKSQTPNSKEPNSISHKEQGMPIRIPKELDSQNRMKSSTGSIRLYYSKVDAGLDLAPVLFSA